MSQPHEAPQYSEPRDARARAKAEKAYQKAQRPWYKKKRFIIPLGLVLLFIIIGIAGGESGSAPTTSGGTTATGQAPDGPPAFPGAKKDDAVAKAGETVTVDGLGVAAGPLTPGDTVGGPTLCTSVVYKNGKDEPVDFNGGFDWKLQDPNGAIVMSTILGSDNLLQAGQIAPGGQASGDVCFTSPKGKASGQYVVLYDPTFRLSADRIAWLNQR